MRNGSIQATLLMSGGIDSAACAHLLRQQGYAVECLFINHGQAAARLERQAVASLAEYFGLPLQTFDMSGSRPFGSGELIGRNAFLVFAALLLTRGRPGLLALGLHAGTPYYDCSEAFVAAIDKLVAEHTDGRVSILAPFVTWSKRDVFDYFTSSKLPIALTYSCEAGTEPTCGICASCRDRMALGC